MISHVCFVFGDYPLPAQPLIDCSATAHRNLKDMSATLELVDSLHLVPSLELLDIAWVYVCSLLATAHTQW